MSNAPRTARDEILAAAEQHGWTVEGGGAFFHLTHSGRQSIDIEFTVEGSEIVDACQFIGSNPRLVLAELAR